MFSSVFFFVFVFNLCSKHAAAPAKQNPNVCFPDGLKSIWAQWNAWGSSPWSAGWKVQPWLGGWCKMEPSGSFWSHKKEMLLCFFFCSVLPGLRSHMSTIPPLLASTTRTTVFQWRRGMTSSLVLSCVQEQLSFTRFWKKPHHMLTIVKTCVEYVSVPAVVQLF